MKNPSKRVHRIVQSEQKRLEAIASNDPEKFAQAVAEIAALETEADVYTCLQCGHDFEHGPHVDILVAAILTFDEKGIVSKTFDLGIQDVIRGQNGRRLKFCSHCVKKWKHDIHDYVEIR